MRPGHGGTSRRWVAVLLCTTIAMGLGACGVITPEFRVELPSPPTEYLEAEARPGDGV